jgi:uncharacterized protein YkwD
LKSAIVQALIVLIASQVGLALAQQTAPEIDSEAENALLQLLNAERHSRGIPELELDARLSSAARLHSARMAAAGRAADQLENEEPIEIQLSQAGIHFKRSSVNVAQAEDVRESHEALMASPELRANVLDPDLNSVGIGVAQRDGDIYVTEYFAFRTTDVTEAEVEEIIAAKFNKLRIDEGTYVLRKILNPKVRSCSCAMAAEDSVKTSLCSPGGKYSVPGAQNAHVIAYTTDDVFKLPEMLTKLKVNNDYGITVGVCFAKSRSYQAPVYWVTAVIYFKAGAQ